MSLTKKNVIDILKGMLESFNNKPSSQGVIDYYVMVLFDDGHSIDQVAWAIKEAGKNASYGCPKPFDILKLLKPSVEDKNAIAEEQWSILYNACFNRDNPDPKQIKNLDDTALYLHDTSYGKMVMCWSDYDRFIYLKINFLKAYHDHSEGSAIKEHIKLKSSSTSKDLQSLSAKMAAGMTQHKLEA